MKKYQVEIKWGLIFVATLLLWMLFEKWMGWHGEKIARHAMMTNLFAIPAIMIYVFALIDKRKNYYSGIMSWKQGFTCGLIITLIATLFSPFTQYLIHTYISPEFFQYIADYSVETGRLSREQAESQFSLKSYIIQSSIGAAVMGVITSAVVAFFTKKKPENGSQPEM